RVQAGEFSAIHPHPAGVERPRDQPANDVRAEAFLADVFLGAVAFLENARPRAEALGIERVRNLRQRYEPRGEFEDAAERRGFRQMRAQALPRFVVEVAERNLAAGPESALGLFVEFDADFLGGIEALVFRDAH